MMKILKVLICFGTRPEAIKMAPLVKELIKDERIDPIVCVTAQHRQMLDQVLDAFEIVPDYDLDIMKSSQTLTQITSRVLNGLEDILRKTNPDIVLVHGDTTTTFVSALASFYMKIPVGHVEAGLRTYNRYSPFPEEMNRRLTSEIAQLHFAPTINNKNNLLRENIDTENIFITGNTVIDALSTTVSKKYKFDNETLDRIDFNSKRIITLTAHRRENLGRPLYNITRAIKRIVEETDDIEVIYPVHLNPQVKKVAEDVLSNVKGVHLIKPLGVLDMHNLIARSFFVMTDSGGIQEEAPSLGRPVLVLRTETERPEAVDAGTVKIVGIIEENIYNEAKKLLDIQSEYEKMANLANPYGDGMASVRIKDALLYFCGIIDKKPKDWTF